MKKTIVLSAILLATNAATITHAENYFGVEGTRWNVETVAFYGDEPEFYHDTYSLEGQATIAGHECLQYLLNGNLLYYVYTEGDKVYCIRPNNPEESLLVYDFGIAVGETATFDIVAQGFNYNFDPHSTQQCTQIAQLTSCGHVYEQMKMIETDYNTTPGYWLKGIGGITLFAGDFANWGYDLDGLNSVLASVEVNGETIYSKDDTVVGISDLNIHDTATSYNLDGTIQTQPAKGLTIHNGRVVLYR